MNNLNNIARNPASAPHKNNILIKMILNSSVPILLILIIIVYTKTLIVSSHYLFHTDFFKFYQSVRFYFAGQNIYDKVIYPLNHYEASIWHSKSLLLNNDLNPPFLTILLLPTALLSYSTALLTWFAFSMLCTLLGCLFILRLHQNLWGNNLLRSWLFIGSLIYFPTYLNLYIGQLSGLLLFITILALYACRQNKQFVAGMLLGFLLSIKIFYGLFIILFIVRKQWRLLMAMITTFFICACSALWVFGADAYKAYIANLHKIYWYSANWNGSLLGFLRRLLGGNHEGNLAVINLPNFTEPLYLLCSIILMIYFVFLIRSGLSSERDFMATDSVTLNIKTINMITKLNSHSAKNGEVQKLTMNDNDNLDWQFSLTIVLMLLLSPLGWVYYFPLLFIPFITVARLNTHLKGFNLNLILLGLVIILSSLPSHYHFPMELTRPLMVFTWGSYYFYALVLLLILLIRLNWQINNNHYFNEKELQINKMSAQSQGLIFIIAALPSLLAFLVACKNYLV